MARCPRYTIMDTYYADVLSQLSAYLAIEDLQVLRMTSRPFSRLIRPRPVDFLTYGVKHNVPEFIRLAASTDPTFSERICEVAAFYNRVDILRSARTNGYAWTPRICAEAARGGHLELLKLLINHRENNDSSWGLKCISAEMPCKWDEWMLVNAAAEGHFHILEWISLGASSDMSPFQDKRTKNVFDAAVLHGKLNIVQWLWNPPSCEYVEVGAYDSYHKPMIKRLYLEYKHKRPSEGVNAETFALAATSGNLELLKWMSKNCRPGGYYGYCDKGCPGDGRVVRNALLGGHYEMAKWARANGCPWDPLTCPAADIWDKHCA